MPLVTMSRRLACVVVFVVAFAAAFVAACGPSIHKGARADAGSASSPLVAITVTPADQELVIDGAQAATATYTAIGRFEDGHSEDISDRALFSLEDGSLGAFSGAAFES